MNPVRAARLCVLMLLLPAISAAQSVDGIVSKHIAARGGTEKLEGIQTLKIAGI